MRARTPIMVAVALLVSASSAAAQAAAWDSPMLASPEPEDGYGFYLFEPAGAGLGLLGTFRGAASPLRFRLGIADGERGSDIGIVAGVDYSQLLRQPSADFPLQVGWLLGVGLGYVEDLLVTIPFGVNFGVPLNPEGLHLVPFVSPRVMVDFFTGGAEDDTDLAFGVDLGVDVRPGPTWGIRFAGTVGDHEGIAIGIIF